MTGYELPLRAIREQIASAVDLIVHTARLKDGSRKIVNITEVYGIDDDEILPRTSSPSSRPASRREDRGRRSSRPDPADVHGRFKSSGRRAAAGRIRHPAARTRRTRAPPQGKGRWGTGDRDGRSMPPDTPVGLGRAVEAGGMVYVSSIGPVDPETGHRGQRRRSRNRRASACPTSRRGWRRPAARSTRSSGRTGRSVTRPSSTSFNEEWTRWFPGDEPVGQGTLMPPLQRRAGFRISIGVIAEA